MIDEDRVAIIEDDDGAGSVEDTAIGVGSEKDRVDRDMDGAWDGCGMEGPAKGGSGMGVS
jgi:hypothetical protein